MYQQVDLLREDRKVARGLVFFHAEDDIRDIGVTGVQTCALPIYGWVPFDPTGGSVGVPTVLSPGTPTSPSTATSVCELPSGVASAPAGSQAAGASMTAQTNGDNKGAAVLNAAT